MKKLFLMFSIIASIFAANVTAQEVRGCTTRRVTYDGKEYSCWGNTYTQYYGWEITNHNSFTISVDLILSSQDAFSSNGVRVVKTQSIILKPKETYIFKREEHTSTHVNCPNSDWPISSYSFDYKAYKL